MSVSNTYATGRGLALDLLHYPTGPKVVKSNRFYQLKNGKHTKRLNSSPGYRFLQIVICSYSFFSVPLLNL